MSITKRSLWIGGLTVSALLYAGLLLTTLAHSTGNKQPATAVEPSLLASAPSIKQDRLAAIQQQKVLTLGLLKTPASYFQRQHDAIGFDYQTAKALADQLKVDLAVTLYDTPQALRTALTTQQVDMIASELSATTLQSDSLAYFSFELVAVQARRHPSLKNTDELKTARGVKSSLSEELNDALSELNLTALTSATPEEILTLVQQGHYDYGLISRHHFQLLSPFFAELKATVNVSEQQLQWHLLRTSDYDNQNFLTAIQDFLALNQNNIEQVATQSFAPIQRFDLYSSRAFKTHWEQRLALYSADFQLAADEHSFDWQLLAAVGYQESHWNPNAISPTGVEGLMMLTKPTAREMGVADRRDPVESIHGGSAYLAGIHKRMPESIHEPNRTWMALAAYNAGYGHLLDARRLTAQQGGNPDLWTDVAKRLPLLTQPQYYENARYGYARGGAQAVYYVEAVQHYYHALLWADQHWGSSTALVAMAP